MQAKEQPLLCVLVLVFILAGKLIIAALKILWPALSSPVTIPEVLRLTEEVKELRRAYIDLNHPDTLVAASKAKRKLDQKELLLRKTVAASGTQPHSHNKKFILSVLEIVCPAMLVVMHWDKEVLRLPPASLWPLASAASFPRNDPGCVSIIPWVFVCQRGSEGLIKAGGWLARWLKKFNKRQPPARAKQA